MTPKQEAFVREYLVDKNATDAAKRAGYSERTAHSAGPRLLANVEIATAIRHEHSKALGRVQITADMILDGIHREATSELPEGASSARIKAWELLAKVQGMLIERSEVGAPGDFDAVPDDELREEAQRLAKQAGIDAPKANGRAG